MAVQRLARLLLVLSLSVGTVHAAGWQLTGTSRAIPGFHQGICTVAIVLEECDAGAYCSTAEGSLAAAVARVPAKPFRFLHPRAVEAKMSQAGYLTWDPAAQAEIADGIGADAVLFLRVPTAEKKAQADGFTGSTTSEFNFRVEIRLVRIADGRTVMTGSGGGIADGQFSRIDRWFQHVFKRIFENPRIAKSFEEAAQSSHCDSPNPVPVSTAETETDSAEPSDDSPPSYIAELRALAELRDQGVITVEDFEAKKRQLLGLER